MFMHELSKLLEHLNLTTTEASVYLAALEVGRGTAYEVANKAGIKKPTGYVVLDSLVRKGVVTASKSGHKTVYAPIQPRRLLELWQGRFAAVEAALPELNRLYRSGTAKPQVHIYEGKKGVDAVYSEIVGVRNTKGEPIRLISSIGAAQVEFGYVTRAWYKAAKDKRNHVKELINREVGIGEYVREIKKLKNPHYELRITRQSVFGKGDNLIYQNKVAIFSLNPDNLFVVFIESEDVAKTYKALFDMAWQQAMPL